MNYKQIYAIKTANEKRILEVCPYCPNKSGIYFLTREEDGFRFAYIGQAKRLRERLASHLSGYQHIDLSLKKHGFFGKDNLGGYKVGYLEFPENVLDEKEQYYIKKYANAGYQMKNATIGGQGDGKKSLENGRPARGYFDGKEAGYLMARREVAHWFSLHLSVSMKKPTKNAEKAYKKFLEFIDLEAEENA